MAGPRRRDRFARENFNRRPGIRMKAGSHGHGGGRSPGQGESPRIGVAAQPQAPAMPAAVQTVTVADDENGMRLDRFFEARYPALSFSHIQRIIRKGEVRVDGRRAQPKDRLAAGQAVRVPPLRLAPPKPREDAGEDRKYQAFLRSITLHEDDDVLVLDKPMGLAVQGGSGTRRHIDGMLDAGGAARPRRPASAPRPPTRQGHLGLPAGGQDPLCRGRAREELPLPIRAQDLLGAGGGRAAAEAGPGLDLPGQRGARG
jgi:hypothetical protein